jgi:hypothetical protein
MTRCLIDLRMMGSVKQQTEEYHRPLVLSFPAIYPAYRRRDLRECGMMPDHRPYARCGPGSRTETAKNPQTASAISKLARNPAP